MAEATFDIVSNSKSRWLGRNEYVWNDAWTADDANQAQSTEGCVMAEYIDSTSIYSCRRTVLAWDTSSLPDGAIVTSAKVRIYPPGAGSIRHGGNPTMFLGLCPSLSENPEVANYGRMKDDWAIASEYVLVGGLDYDEYNEINLITAGVNNINTTGWTKFSVRNSIDLAGTQPNATYAYVVFAFGSYPCQLVVTYTYQMPSYYWIEDTDSPINRWHFIDSEGLEQTNLTVADVDDVPVDGATTAPVSSNWAYDYAQLWEDKKKLAYLGL